MKKQHLFDADRKGYLAETAVWIKGQRKGNIALQLKKESPLGKWMVISCMLLGVAFTLNAQETAAEGPSAAGIIEETMLSSGMDAADRRFQELRSAPAGQYLFMEGEFNTLGYRLIRKGRFTEAVRVFEMNVELFPGSANVYDSLSEGYLYLGQKQG